MRAFLGCFAVLWVVAACGGGSSSGAEPKSAADEASASSDASPRESSEGDSSEVAEAPARPKGPSCDDGTCSLCGEGICPAGWYCDEKASGGGACSWLAQCAGKATCSCVTRVLGAACKCREEGGGLKVSCD